MREDKQSQPQSARLKGRRRMEKLKSIHRAMTAASICIQNVITKSHQQKALYNPQQRMNTRKIIFTPLTFNLK